LSFNGLKTVAFGYRETYDNCPATNGLVHFIAEHLSHLDGYKSPPSKNGNTTFLRHLTSLPTFSKPDIFRISIHFQKNPQGIPGEIFDISPWEFSRNPWDLSLKI